MVGVHDGSAGVSAGSARVLDTNLLVSATFAFGFYTNHISAETTFPLGIQCKEKVHKQDEIGLPKAYPMGGVHIGFAGVSVGSTSVQDTNLLVSTT